MTVKNIKKKSSRQKCRNYELTIGFFTQLLQKKFNVLGYSILFVLTSHLLSVQHGMALTLSACKAGRGQLESGDLHIARCALAKECWKTLI